jgi:hypothetical protein
MYFILCLQVYVYFSVHKYIYTGYVMPKSNKYHKTYSSNKSCTLIWAGRKF